MKSIQNWPGTSGHLGRRSQADQPFLEALGLQAPGERLFDDEHDAVAPSPQNIADSDAIVRRTEGALGEEHDRAAIIHRGLGCHPVAARRR